MDTLSNQNIGTVNTLCNKKKQHLCGSFNAQNGCSTHPVFFTSKSSTALSLTHTYTLTHTVVSNIFLKGRFLAVLILSPLHRNCLLHTPCVIKMQSEAPVCAQWLCPEVGRGEEVRRKNTQWRHQRQSLTSRWNLGHSCIHRSVSSSTQLNPPTAMNVDCDLLLWVWVTEASSSFRFFLFVCLCNNKQGAFTNKVLVCRGLSFAADVGCWMWAGGEGVAGARHGVQSTVDGFSN